MARAYRRASKPGHRICQKCEQELPATSANFVTDASRSLGLGYECKPCHAHRKVGRDRSKESSGALTGERREKWKARQNRYFATPRGRAQYMRARYKQIDACDLTLDEMEAALALPCHYCGTTEMVRGLDRIDNAKAHVKGNVLTACFPCNRIRGRRMTVDEALAHIQSLHS